jgi:hypothetical protein
MSQKLAIEEYFSSLPDLRMETTNLRHKFIDILVRAICGIICGAEGGTAIEKFGKAKEEWLRSFLELPNGIPSHDTFTDVFAKLSARRFEAGFISWIKSISELFDGEIVAVDGKTLRRSHEKSYGKKAIHIVSAWAAENSFFLGQIKTDDKSNGCSSFFSTSYTRKI